MRFVATLGRPPAILRRASASGLVVRRRRAGGAGSRGTAAGLPEQELPILCRVARADGRNWPWTLFWWFLLCGAKLAGAFERRGRR